MDFQLAALLMLIEAAIAALLVAVSGNSGAVEVSDDSTASQSRADYLDDDADRLDFRLGELRVQRARLHLGGKCHVQGDWLRATHIQGPCEWRSPTIPIMHPHSVPADRLLCGIRLQALVASSGALEPLDYIAYYGKYRARVDCRRMQQLTDSEESDEPALLSGWFRTFAARARDACAERPSRRTATLHGDDWELLLEIRDDIDGVKRLSMHASLPRGSPRVARAAPPRTLAGALAMARLGGRAGLRSFRVAVRDMSQAIRRRASWPQLPVHLAAQRYYRRRRGSFIEALNVTLKVELFANDVDEVVQTSNGSVLAEWCAGNDVARGVNDDVVSTRWERVWETLVRAEEEGEEEEQEQERLGWAESVLLSLLLAAVIACALRPVRRRALPPSSDGVAPPTDGGDVSRRDWRIDPDEVELTRIIGRGAFGHAYHATWRGAEVVAKIPSVCLAAFDDLYDITLDPSVVADFVNEARVLSELANHPRVVRFCGAVTTPPKLMMVLQYMPVGSLEGWHVLRARTEQECAPPLHASAAQQVELIRAAARRAPLLASILRDTVAAVAHLHKNGAVHADIASRNILLDDNFHGFLADFGLARMERERGVGSDGDDEKHVSGNQRRPRNHRLPYAWAAPETLALKPATSAADVWALGCTILEVIQCGRPWPRAKANTVRRDVIEHRKTPLDDLNARLGVLMMLGEEEEATLLAVWPSELIDLMKRCWAYNPSERPSAKTLHTELTKLCERLESKTHRLRAVSSATHCAGALSADAAASSSGGENRSSPDSTPRGEELRLPRASSSTVEGIEEEEEEEEEESPYVAFSE